MNNSVTVTVGCVAAWIAWAAAFGLVLADLLLGMDLRLAPLGLCLSAAATTLHIRHVLAGMAARERNAFELGQDAARIELRSVH